MNAKINLRTFLGLIMAATPGVGCAAAWLVKKKREALTRNPCLDLPSSPIPVHLICVKEGDEAVVELWANAIGVGSNLVGSLDLGGYKYQEVTYTQFYNYTEYQKQLVPVLVSKRIWVKEVQRIQVRPEMQFHRIMHYRTTLFS